MTAADRKFSLVSAATGEVLRLFDGGHTSGLNDCCWMSDRLIATASDDHTVRVWDIEQDKPISSFKASKSFIYSMSVDVGNKLLVTGSFDGSVHMFHMSMREPIISFPAHAEPIVSLKYSPTGNHQFLTAAQDGLVRMWEGPSCIATVVVHEAQGPTSAL